MVQVIPAGELTLHEVKTKFGLQQVEDELFFSEWQDLSELADSDKRSLDLVKGNFLYLDQYPMSEEAVKLVVLSPLLAMAGFYGPPFRMRTEVGVQIALENEGEVVRGRIDVLVLHRTLLGAGCGVKRSWIFPEVSDRASASLHGSKSPSRQTCFRICHEWQ